MSYKIFKTDEIVFAIGKLGIENLWESIRKYVLKKIKNTEVQESLKEVTN